MRLHESAPESAAPRAPSHPHRRRTVARSLPRRSLRVWIKEIFSSTRRIRRRSPSRRQRRRRPAAAAAAVSSSPPPPVVPTASYSALCCSNTSVRTSDRLSLSTLAAASRRRPFPSHPRLVLVLVLVLASSLRRRVVASPSSPSPSRRHRDPSLRQSRPERLRERAHRVARCRPAGRPPDRRSQRGPAVRNTNAKKNGSRRECERNARDDRPTFDATPSDRGAHASARGGRAARTDGADGVGRSGRAGERRTANGERFERRTANGERRFERARARGIESTRASDGGERWIRDVARLCEREDGIFQDARARGAGEREL